MNKTQTNKVIKIRHLTESTFVLRLERNNFQFTPGQCVNIGLVNNAINREYSTYSGINDNFLEFIIKEIKNGLVSTKLKKLKPGNKVSLDGAYGLFTLKEPQNTKINYTFIATGTGIAPFHAFTRSYPKINYQILHGIKNNTEEYDKKDYQKGKYISCTSQANNGNFHGRVTGYLKTQKNNPKNIYYICGNSDMINDVYDLLTKQGVNGSNIFTESFF